MAMPPPDCPRRAQQAEDDKTRRPQGDLTRQRESGFDQERVAEQRQQRADIAERVETVRGLVGIDPAVPGLQERTGGRQQEIRHTDVACAQQQNVPGRLFERRGGLPRIRRGNGKQNRRPGQKGNVQCGLCARGQVAVAEVGIGISTHEKDLEEEQRRRPHRRRAAVPRQDVLADQRLNLEQQESRDEDDQAE